MFLIRPPTLFFKQVHSKQDNLIVVHVGMNMPIIPVFAPEQVKANKNCKQAIQEIKDEVSIAARGEISSKHTALLAIRTSNESLSLETLIANWRKLMPVYICKDA